ncbi:MAG TPA: YebC/PmpR family DNA-binding transcriptional regulator [Candidatus Kapabacteria bacterium]|nr:YebC/PmpR family DNA-binding transcriptional regulator [Candidatus Kapabacteria bacterium]
MGRAFEFRRARKEKRWANMAKTFTKIGREIAIAVKQGGADPSTNPRLRMAIQNAKGANMPKDNVESAIKRASSKEEGNFQEAVYEGYGPNGVAIMVECATDNPTRTVANVRMYFNRAGGALGTSGSLDFMFERKGVFAIPAEGVDTEALELELIDHGAEEVTAEEGSILIYTQFSDFGAMQKALDERGIIPTSAQLQRIPTTTTELNDEQAEAVMGLIERLEEDDDVQAVYHNIA